MQNGAIIHQTLERVAELHGDPADIVYAHLFRVHPEYEELFAMDAGGGVRGTMLATSLDCVMGIADGTNLPQLLMEAAELQHDAYGLQGNELGAMFSAMASAFAEILADEWSPQHQAAWDATVDELSKMA